MKKISVLHKSKQVRWWDEEAIFIRTYDYDYKDIYEIISSDGKQIVWTCDAQECYVRKRVYDSCFIRYGFHGLFKKRDFLLIIKDLYPEDFEFFLWYPETKYGNWNRQI